MNTSRFSLLAFLLIFFTLPAFAQVIKGEVTDRETGKPIDGVTIQNIHTSLGVITGETGTFIIAAASDQLLEFKKQGFQTARVRIPKGLVPPYFKIIMQQGFKVEREVVAQSGRYNYRDDSIRFHSLYKHELDFPRLSAFGSIQHPFSALSRRNREIWKFQESFSETEKEKYIDRTFNPELVARVTGLRGDSLNYYLVRYRPQYDDLRNMNDYSFFSYIKRTAHTYRSRVTPRNSQ